MSNHTTHLMADTANGVQVVDPVDFPDADWIGFNDFMSSLRGLDDGEQLFAIADPDQLETLSKDYSVN